MAAAATLMLAAAVSTAPTADARNFGRGGFAIGGGSGNGFGSHQDTDNHRLAERELGYGLGLGLLGAGLHGAFGDGVCAPDGSIGLGGESCG